MATFLRADAHLGDTKLEGQVIVLDIDGVQLRAPSRANPWFKLDVRGVLPVDGIQVPSATDVRWLQSATLYLVAVFPEGTIGTRSLT